MVDGGPTWRTESSAPGRTRCAPDELGREGQRVGVQHLADPDAGLARVPAVAADERLHLEETPLTHAHRAEFPVHWAHREAPLTFGSRACPGGGDGRTGGPGTSA